MLLNLLRLSNMEAYQHSLRVAELTRLMVANSTSHYTPEEKKDIVTGALLHDIGKTYTPFNLSQYPGSLTHTQKHIMQIHATLSYEIVKPVYSEIVAEICLKHHLYGDNTGYPAFTGDDMCVWLPKYVQWVQVADIYDALTSDRVYRPAMTETDALETMNDDARHKKISEEALSLLKITLIRKQLADD